MIRGLKYWNDKSTYYTQTNHPTEELLRKEDGKGYLETCGPTSAVNILAARGDDIVIKTPGSYKPQPEEILTDWFNDPRNYAHMQALRDGVDPAVYMGNEIPQYYPAAIMAVFGVRAFFYWGSDWDHVTMALSLQRGVMLALKKPGHFIAAVAYREIEKAIIYRDPWPGNPWPVEWKNRSGFNRSISGLQLENLQPYRIEIG